MFLTHLPDAWESLRLAHFNKLLVGTLKICSAVTLFRGGFFDENHNHFIFILTSITA